MIKPNQCTFPKQQVETCGVTIATIWDVDADARYDISIEKSIRDSHALSEISGEGTIVIRTLEGQGRIHTSSGEVHELNEDTLFLINYREITRYHTTGSNWRFWWIEIYNKNPLDIPERSVLPCPIADNDISDFEELTASMRLNSIEHIRLATTKFLHMLYSWWSRDRLSQEEVPAHARMVEAITLMHNDLSNTISIEQIAEATGMSTTGFRKAFKSFTGQSPKAFYDELRLKTAREMLRKGVYNVTQAAAQTGFCDAYHLSKAFRKHFGIPPSHIHRK